MKRLCEVIDMVGILDSSCDGTLPGRACDGDGDGRLGYDATRDRGCVRVRGTRLSRRSSAFQCRRAVRVHTTGDRCRLASRHPRLVRVRV